MPYRCDMPATARARRSPMHLRHPLGPFGPWFYPFILASIAAEIAWYLLAEKRAYPWQEMRASLGVALLRAPLRLLRPAIVAPLALFVWSHRLATVPLDTAWGLALLFLGVEFAYYWMHRASHEIRWMWASHVVHHTPRHLHLASAFRLGSTELLSGTWLFHLPLYLLGFHPVAIHGMFAVNLFYQFWLHTDLVGRLGPLEWVFNTPSHHRVHHAANADYLDRNYGGILIVWDRLFGTFAAERPQLAIAYGLAHPIGSLNPITLTFHEWRAIARDLGRARSWRERLRLTFGRPGERLALDAPGPAGAAVAAE
jgi:sterol desaturase/sphingolipid hydroxylase (fatty acid hydroxylase superfamily)